MKHRKKNEMIDFQFPNKKIQNQPSTDDRVNKIKPKKFKKKKKKKKLGRIWSSDDSFNLLYKPYINNTKS